MLKFNPLNNSLYNSQNKILKQLNCPYFSAPLKIEKATESVNCQICSKTVVAVSHMTETQVEELLDKHPEQCISVDLNWDLVEVSLNVGK